MKHPRLRAVLAVILTILLVLIFVQIVVVQNAHMLEKNTSGKETVKLEATSRTLMNLGSSWAAVEEQITTRYEMNAILSAAALRNVITGQGDEAILSYPGGAVIRIEGDTLHAPDQIGEKYGLTPGLFTGTRGIFASPEKPSVLVTYSRISNSPYYYVVWYEDTDLDETIREVIDIQGILRKTEAAYGVCSVFIVEDPSQQNGSRVVYYSNLFEEEAERGKFDFDISQLEEYVGEKGLSMTINGAAYQYSVCKVESLDGYILLMIPSPHLYMKSLSQSTYMIAAFILLLAGFVTAALSLYGYVRVNRLTPALEKWYRPSHVRRLAALYGLAGILIIALCGIVIYSLNDLYDNSLKGSERLQMLESGIAMDVSRNEQFSRSAREVYLEYGTRIASLLDTYPELRTGSVLASLADSISASAITLYDHTGKETVSSSDCIDLALGTSPEDSTSDFRRILKGAQGIIHDAEPDSISGVEEVKIGIRINDASAEGKYGVMMLSMDPSMLDYDVSRDIQNSLNDLAVSDAVIWIADPETGKIWLSSDSLLSGKTIFDIGLKETDLKGSLVNTIATAEGNFFVTSSVLNDSVLNNAAFAENSENEKNPIAYFAIEEKTPNYNLAASVVTGLLVFLSSYVFLAWLLLYRYRDDYVESCKNSPSDDPDKHRTVPGRAWSSARPEKRASIVMEILGALFLIQQIPIASLTNRDLHNTVDYYIMHGDWARGVNLFAIAKICILGGEILLGVIVIRLLLRSVNALVGKTGETVCRLIDSLVRYVALFSFIIFMLLYLGVDATTMLASVGVLSLALSLGAQSFIADIIAGLMIIFEGTFHVGDRVEISGYRGTVEAISMHATRILTAEGNVVTINNKDIGNIVNLTELSSYCFCEIMVSSECDISEIEALLEKELPAIGENDSRILSGPFYWGITRLGYKTITLTVAAECSEADRFAVKNMLNGELQRIIRGKNPGIK